MPSPGLRKRYGALKSPRSSSRGRSRPPYSPRSPGGDGKDFDEGGTFAPPPAPPISPMTPRAKAEHFLRERADTLKRLPTHKRFWFTVGTLLGLILPSFLIAPKVRSRRRRMTRRSQIFLGL